MKKIPARLRVGVLYGGWSAERAISLKSGAAVLGALRRLGVKHAGIDVTPRVAEQIRRAQIDVAFLAVHGPFGEDGTLQGLLDIMGVPYTGSGVLASAMAMHKPTAKKMFEAAGLPTPPGFTALAGGHARPPHFRHPWVVKPASQGSAIGVEIVRKPSEWTGALRRAWRLEPEAVVERCIEGVEVTVGILDGRALPVVEIVPKHKFYDFYSKYAKGGSRHIVPARLPDALQKKIRGLAEEAFQCLGCRHMARVDFMVSRNGAPWILEVNTLPGLTDVSLLPDAARAVGIGFDDLVLRLLQAALKK